MVVITGATIAGHRQAAVGAMKLEGAGRPGVDIRGSAAPS